MRRYASSPLFLSLICMVSVLTTTVIALYVSRSATSQASQEQSAADPIIVYETEALHVESLTTEVADPQLGGTRYILKLKNVSGKKIITFAVEQPNGGGTSVDYTPGVGALPPGAIEKIEMADYSQPDPGSASTPQRKRITIKLVMFEDGSSEGDFKIHERFTNRYFGRKSQLKRINAILKESLAASKDLTQIVSEISALPDDAPPGENKAIGEGYVEAKNETLRLLKSLTEWRAASQKDPNIARNILQKTSGDLVGITRPDEGITRIINANQRLIERSGNR
jgi:hypothetical protein